jgi:hypothetical protein
MDSPLEIEIFCFHCNVKMNNTQAVQLMPCCHAVCVWCMIEQQQQTKEDHDVMTCYCKVAVISHEYIRPVAGGQISRSHNQVELLETVRENHDSCPFEPGVDDIRARIDKLCRMDGVNRKDKIGEGLILTSQIKLFLNENGLVRLVENSKSFSAIQQHAIFISEDDMQQLIQLARNIGSILLSTSSTTEFSKEPLSLMNLLKFILSDNCLMPRIIFAL